MEINTFSQKQIVINDIYAYLIGIIFYYYLYLYSEFLMMF